MGAAAKCDAAPLECTQRSGNFGETVKKIVLIVLLIAPAVAFAQGGCVDSPENPTMVLGLVGLAAVYARQRFTRGK